MGWILLATALFFVVQADASMYTVIDYRQHSGHLLFGPLAVLVQPSWAPAIVCMVLALLLFPDARLPLWPLALILWPFLGTAGLWVLGAFGIAAHAIATNTVHITTSGDLSQLQPARWQRRLVGHRPERPFFPVILISGLGSLAKQVISYRRATGERRQQLKWLLAGGMVFLVVASSASRARHNNSPLERALGFLGILGIAALPVFLGIAIFEVPTVRDQTG